MLCRARSFLYLPTWSPSSLCYLIDFRSLHFHNLIVCMFMHIYSFWAWKWMSACFVVLQKVCFVLCKWSHENKAMLILKEICFSIQGFTIQYSWEVEFTVKASMACLAKFFCPQTSFFFFSFFFFSLFIGQYNYSTATCQCHLHLCFADFSTVSLLLTKHCMHVVENIPWFWTFKR